MKMKRVRRKEEDEYWSLMMIIMSNCDYCDYDCCWKFWAKQKVVIFLFAVKGRFWPEGGLRQLVINRPNDRSSSPSSLSSSSSSSPYAECWMMTISVAFSSSSLSLPCRLHGWFLFGNYFFLIFQSFLQVGWSFLLCSFDAECRPFAVGGLKSQPCYKIKTNVSQFSADSGWFFHWYPPFAVPKWKLLASQSELLFL